MANSLKIKLNDVVYSLDDQTKLSLDGGTVVGETEFTKDVTFDNTIHNSLQLKSQTSSGNGEKFITFSSDDAETDSPVVSIFENNNGEVVPAKLSIGEPLNDMHATNKKYVDDKFSALQKMIEDNHYTKITATLSHNAGTREKGDSISNVVLSWNLSKEPKSVIIDGKAVATAKSGKYTDPNTYTSTKTWNLSAKELDEKGGVATTSTTVNFYNGIYYGVIEDGVEITSSVILGLTKKVKSTRDITFTADANSSSRVAYACPAKGYGTPSFKDKNTGFQASFYLATPTPIRFKNSKEYEEDYNVWLSTHVGLGSITVEVS